MKCNAVLYHGPGHQSKAYCHVTEAHRVHTARYGRYDALAHWLGEKGYTDAFDDPPVLDEEELVS